MFMNNPHIDGNGLSCGDYNYFDLVLGHISRANTASRVVPGGRWPNLSPAKGSFLVADILRSLTLVRVPFLPFHTCKCGSFEQKDWTDLHISR